MITSPNSFCSTANAAKHCKAKVEFIDIDYDTGNISLKKLEKQIKKKIDVITPVHFGGLAVDMATIKKLTLNKKIILIEDAAHALGAKYKDGSMVGNYRYSDMTVFLFIL